MIYLSSLKDDQCCDFLGTGWYGAQVGCYIQPRREYEDQRYFVWHKCHWKRFVQHEVSIRDDFPPRCNDSRCKAEFPSDARNLARIVRAVWYDNLGLG